MFKKIFWHSVFYLLFMLSMYTVYQAFMISYRTDGVVAFWIWGFAIVSVIAYKTFKSHRRRKKIT